MILVDIYLPVLDKTYDFSLDENACVEDVTEEIIEVVCQQEQCELLGSPQDLILCQMERHRILARDSTLSENGICAGDCPALL